MKRGVRIVRMKRLVDWSQPMGRLLIGRLRSVPEMMVVVVVDVASNVPRDRPTRGTWTGKSYGRIHSYYKINHGPTCSWRIVFKLTI